MRNLLGKITPTAAAVSVAILLSAGGGAYAATQFGKGSIGSWYLKDGGVKQADLAPWVQRQVSKAGTPGPQGPQGEKGDPGTYGNVIHWSTAATLAPGETSSSPIVANCADTGAPLPPEQKADLVAISGGFSVDGSRDTWQDIQVIQDRNTVDGKGWQAYAVNHGTAPHDVRVWVVCVTDPDDNPED